ncbi:MAG: Biotin carboxylase [Alphaproteobacteria bacterium MarineAlpha9_Bin6]|nr:MAG: Biotin carboxylase [Alphaproteobacteria bacterium MarineAlpha9_Bin6]
MSLASLLVANRGEIAVRILRASGEAGLRTVSVYSEDDSSALHVRMADESRPLPGVGAKSYLDAKLIVKEACAAGCDAVHPGYGFLSENPDFALLCEENGLAFVGPTPEQLKLFGDKLAARAHASACGVPVARGTEGSTSLKEVLLFLKSLGEGGAMMIKAVAGGGGRGIREVHDGDDAESAYERCRSEALRFFGNDEVYAEELISHARHIEVQVVGDGTGSVIHLGERECSLQRQRQKLIEIAPCPGLSEGLRQRLAEAATRLAAEVKYKNLGTFEFLVDARSIESNDGQFVFIEANPRLQVEHTVTEEVTGVDLVRLQIDISSGLDFQDLNFRQPDVNDARGHAIQVRVNMETMNSDGMARPAGGTVVVFEVPTGPGVRVDSFGYGGYQPSSNFDSLLAKVIAHHPSLSFSDAVTRCSQALEEFRIEGVATNISFLQAILAHPDVVAGKIHTRFVEENIGPLIETANALSKSSLDLDTKLLTTEQRRAGASIDERDPLAVLDYGKDSTLDVEVVTTTTDGGVDKTSANIETTKGTVPIIAPMQGTVVGIDVSAGDKVRGGQNILIMEAMKMEHVIVSNRSGFIRELAVSVGDTVFEGYPLVFLEADEVQESMTEESVDVDIDHVRDDLAAVQKRHSLGYDHERPEAVARRRKTGQRTARENIADLCDPGSFIEYGPLIIAAQRQRHSVKDLIERTPADGLVSGVGGVNGDLFGESKSRCVVMSYDYTVLAGTQGFMNHDKKDRMFEIAERSRLPVVFFTEGGGGRPGDTDGAPPAGLNIKAFYLFGKLSGLVPLVGITSGRCFAGNAALLGCCDVIIATENSNIGMGGPAMIEGGGLGVFRPEEVGPMEVQVANGVVDLLVSDEAEAVSVAKRYISYFQGSIEDWNCEDQRLLRNVIPENRLRVYDVRKVIDTLADKGSVLELRRHFGLGMVTALIRVEGKPLGLVANNPMHLAGAIDSNGADKAARFMQLCDAFDLPVLLLCDTPGMMVGPEVEKTALVRHCCRLFVTGANLTVPFFTIVLRKGYGLGAQAMAGGSYHAPLFTVSWPTGEFGGMGLEGAVKLGYRKELVAIEDPDERKALFEKMVARAYAEGEALNAASHFEFDDVIDPAESRRWITGALHASPPPTPRTGKKRPNIDTW